MAIDGTVAARAWRGGRSEWRIHLLSTFALAVAFVCLASALLVLVNMDAVRDRWSRAGRATVYLRDAATEAEVAEIQRALASTPGVNGTRYVSAAEARREVVTDEHNIALAALPASAFPQSLEVGFHPGVTDAELESMALKLRLLPAVETVETYQRWTERLGRLVDGGLLASGLLALVVLGSVVSVVGATVRLMLQRRRVEVEVLRLVGATTEYVRRPFVLEGATQGAGGAALAVLLVFVLYLVVRGRFDHELAALLGVSPVFLPGTWVALFVAFGGGLGAAAASISLRRWVRA